MHMTYALELYDCLLCTYSSLMINLNFNTSHMKTGESNLGINDTISNSCAPYNIIYFNQYAEYEYRATQSKFNSQ